MSNPNSSLSSFTPLGKIGEGAYSSVYKVRRLSDQCIYALKKIKIAYLKQKQKANALNEIRILASISSSFIITYKQAFFDEQLQLLCIVMEWANQGDLLKRITDSKERRKQMPESQVWKAAYHILSGLRILHSNSILHRDLKSANIFISNGIYKLGDLNVSKVNDNQQRLVNTQTGTPYYASPEIWRDQPYGSAADIWSFGCILYEMCSFHPPFLGKDLNELYQNVLRGQYQLIPHTYSAQLKNLIRKCLMSKAIDRPTAEQLIQVGGTVQVSCDFYSIKITEQSKKTVQQQLLSTIQMPSDMNKLNKNLPNPKYQTDKKLQLNNRQKDRLLSQSKQNPLNIAKSEELTESNKYSQGPSNPSQIITTQEKNKSALLPLPERIKNHLNGINRKANQRLANRRPVIRKKLISSISQHHRCILDKKIQNFSIINKQDTNVPKRPFSCNYRVRNIDSKYNRPNTAITNHKYTKIQSTKSQEYQIKVSNDSHILYTANKISQGHRNASYLQAIKQKYRCRSAIYRQVSNPIYSQLQRRLEVRGQNLNPFPSYFKLNKDVYLKQRYQSKSEASLNQINQKIYSGISRSQPKHTANLGKIINSYSKNDSSSYLEDIQNKILSSANPKARKCEYIFGNYKKQWQIPQRDKPWANYRI